MHITSHTRCQQIATTSQAARLSPLLASPSSITHLGLRRSGRAGGSRSVALHGGGAYTVECVHSASLRLAHALCVQAKTFQGS